MTQTTLAQLIVLLARLVLWLGAFSLVLLGLFTVPALMVGLGMLLYVLYRHVRHRHA